jgi:hypothetical protein
MTRKFEKYTYVIRSERRKFPLAKTNVGAVGMYPTGADICKGETVPVAESGGQQHENRALNLKVR